ncbi:MAG: class I SAM-dependent methyltransferase [Flavobacteriaceae bacterium]|nr:class I SAM-dependent methyltransferase [Flavobacteriaceae bacterium]
MKKFNTQKDQVDKGFSAIYKNYEELNRLSWVDQYMRKCVYRHVEQFISPNSSILELNCGSGIDASYFAQQGNQVLATDIAQSSSAYVKQKKEELKLNNLTFQLLDFENILALQPQKFDYIFSNFGGFNCVSQPEDTFCKFKKLLQPNAVVSLCVLGRYYPWEWLYALKGDFNLAFRRFNKNGVIANVEGGRVQTFYYTPHQIKEKMGDEFQLLKVESLGFAFPSVNFQKVHQFKKLSKLLIYIDQKMHQWNIVPTNLGDYFIISFRFTG